MSQQIRFGSVLALLLLIGLCPYTASRSRNGCLARWGSIRELCRLLGLAYVNLTVGYFSDAFNGPKWQCYPRYRQLQRLGG